MFTVITKGNNVSKHNNPAKLGLIDHIIVITDSGEIILNQGNPITWPTATSGMQAIVDVKASTLRFGYDGWPRAQTEFVVSEYVESVTSAPHIFDVINYWPQQDRQCLGTKDLPEGWMWQWAGNDWVLSLFLQHTCHADTGLLCFHHQISKVSLFFTEYRELGGEDEAG